MASNRKAGNSTVFYVGWTFCVIVLIGLSVWGSRAYYSHAGKDYTSQNERQIERFFSQLENSYQVTVADGDVDSTYIDSLNTMKMENARVIEEAITSRIIDQISNNGNIHQSQIDSSNRILFIWATILAFIILIAIFFAYLGLKKQLSQLPLNSDDDSYDEDYHKNYMPGNYSSDSYSIKKEGKPISTYNDRKEGYTSQNAVNEKIKEEVKESQSPVFVSKEPENKESVSTPQVKSKVEPAAPQKDYDNEISSIVKNGKDNDEKISSLKILINDIKEDSSLDTEQKNLYLYKAFFYLAQLFKNAGEDDKALTVYEKLIQTNASQPAVFFERGNLYKDMGKYAEAINDYNQVLKLYPDSDEGYLNRGIAYLDIEKYQEAINDFSSVIKIDKDNAEAAFYRGYANFSLGNYNEALTDFDSAAKLGYDDSRLYNLKGVLLADRKEYPQAVADFTKAIELDGQTAKTYVNRGYVYSEIGEYEKAIEDYDKALSLDTDMTDVISKRGEAYYYSHNYEKALADFDKAIEADSANMEAYRKKGMTNYRLERYEEAVDDFDKTLSLASDADDLSDIQELRADAILKTRGTEEVVFAEKTAEKQPKADTNESVYFNQATEAFNRSDFSSAIEYFNKVLELNPNNTEVLFMKGMAHNYLKEYDLAIVDFNKSLALSPAQPEVYYNRANTYVNLQKVDDALADYASAIHFNPTIPEVYFNRGNIYYNRGQFREALLDYTRAVEINPEYTKAYFNRGLAYKTTEQNLKAIADFKKVMELDADNVRIVEKAQKQIDLLSRMVDTKGNLEE